MEKTKIVAVGEKTANECTRLFNKVDIIPSLYSAEGLLKELKNINLFNKNILIPKSSLSKEFLEIELKKLGANVFSEIIYKNTLPDRSELAEIIKLISTTNIDAFIFSSPSSFINTLKLLDIKKPEVFFDNKIIAVIGETTQQEVEKYGSLKIIKPKVSTLENLAISLYEYFNLKGDLFEKS